MQVGRAGEGVVGGEGGDGEGWEGGNVRRGRRGGGKRGGTDIEKDVCSDATIHLFEQVTQQKTSCITHITNHRAVVLTHCNPSLQLKTTTTSDHRGRCRLSNGNAPRCSGRTFATEVFTQC